MPEIILLRRCATLAGADDVVEMTLWGERNLGFLAGWDLDDLETLIRGTA